MLPKVELVTMALKAIQVTFARSKEKTKILLTWLCYFRVGLGNSSPKVRYEENTQVKKK